MKHAVFAVLMLAAPAFAGPVELERDIAKAKVTLDWMVKKCREKPQKEQPACLREVNREYAEVIKLIRAQHGAKK